jgi:hypothetical protein
MIFLSSEEHRNKKKNITKEEYSIKNAIRKEVLEKIIKS